MKTFVFQTSLQVAIIAVIWVLVARDASRLREQHGTAPSGVSPFAWGALCGLTWIALIPYLGRRRSMAGTTAPVREQNLLRWWIVLAALAVAWSALNAAQHDGNNTAQHALLAGTFVACAAIAWSRDRASHDARPQPSTTPPAVAADDRP